MDTHLSKQRSNSVFTTMGRWLLARAAAAMRAWAPLALRAPAPQDVVAALGALGRNLSLGIGTHHSAQVTGIPGRSTAVAVIGQFSWRDSLFP